MDNDGGDRMAALELQGEMLTEEVADLHQKVKKLSNQLHALARELCKEGELPERYFGGEELDPEG